MWNREELFWGVVNPCSPEILSGSCRTDLLCVCLAFLRDYQHAAAAMPGIEKLPIEETLEDSPQVTALLPEGVS